MCARQLTGPKEYRYYCWLRWWWCIIYLSHFSVASANSKTMLCIAGTQHTVYVSNDLPISIAHYYTRIYDCTPLLRPTSFVCLILHMNYVTLFAHGAEKEPENEREREKEHQNDNVKAMLCLSQPFRRRNIKLHENLALTPKCPYRFLASFGIAV